ncbi:hypothetical protein [Variovorax sp. 160MFSha2.1]|uniref:hypothetical protein n=1 Tax=Variovorax sp. 160MFSha2.1 TaxID=3158367 RepID=UPI003AAC4AC2
MNAEIRSGNMAEGLRANTPYAYLLELLQMRLPAYVVDRHELKLVSLLKATGLIEAEVYTSGNRKPCYGETTAATVRRITENGLEELADTSRDLLRSTRRTVGNFLSPLEYLCLIADSPFPLRIEGGASIRSILVLKAAGFIDASISPISEDYPDVPRQALIIRITALGRDEIARPR